MTLTHDTGGVYAAIALRLTGLWQSYGASSVGTDRSTEDAPTKSAIVGMLGAALGVDRSQVDALVALDRAFAMIVCVDARGTLESDFHTAQGIPPMEPSASRSDRNDALTKRYYLADASFTVLVVTERRDEERLFEWHEALRYPRYVPTLGRRACAPGKPLVLSRCTVLRGDDWRALLDAAEEERVRIEGEIERGIPWFARTEARRFEDVCDVYLDEHLCSEEERTKARRIVLRDRVVGPSLRMFYDRPVRVLRWERPKRAGSPARVRGATESERDTTEGWL
jgi:CRISPR-associated protein Cas5/CasD subtype I-E